MRHIIGNAVKNVETVFSWRGSMNVLREEKGAGILDYTFVVWATIVYVESRIQTKIQYPAMADEIGFSLSRLRAIFMDSTGKPLAKYIMERRVSRAAFDVTHTKDNLSAIAERYGFTNPDNFTRAFKRITGLNPSEFRRIKPPVERIKLCAGVFGFAVPKYYEKS